MSAKVSMLAVAAVAADPERKRQVDRAERKSAKNQARYLVNLVAETAGPNLERYSTTELLQAALQAAEHMAGQRVVSRHRMPSESDYLAALGPCGR